MPSDLSAAAILDGLATRYLGRPLHHYPEVPSTQDLAREDARRGAPEGAVHLADHQTAGRGRLGRRWEEPSGSSLLVSIVLRPSQDLYPKLPMLGAVAAARAIEQVAAVETGLKWPNDVLVAGKKVAGVLVEGEFEGDRLVFAVMGIGINVNLDPAAIPDPVYPLTSLRHETGVEVSRVALARSLFHALEQGLDRARSGEPVEEEWRARLLTLGRRVRVRTADGVDEGVAADVRADGSLVLRHDDGTSAVLRAGDVTLQA